MDKNTKIIQRIMKTKTEDVIHSSAYAKMQNAGNFGATSGENFAARKSIEERRKFVRGYNNSRIMAGAGFTTPRAKTYAPPSSTSAPSRFSPSGTPGGNGPTPPTPAAPRVPNIRRPL